MRTRPGGGSRSRAATSARRAGLDARRLPLRRRGLHARAAGARSSCRCCCSAPSSDRLVSPTAIRARRARSCPMPSSKCCRTPAHEILREADPVRLAALARIDAFLDRRARVTDVAIIGARHGRREPRRRACRPSVGADPRGGGPARLSCDRPLRRLLVGKLWRAADPAADQRLAGRCSPPLPQAARRDPPRRRGAAGEAGRAGGGISRRRRCEPLDRAALEAAIPGLRPGWDRGLAEPSCADIDVAAPARRLSAGAAKADLVTDAQADRRRAASGRWRIETSAGPFEADILVNAAGAWADEVARAGGRAAARHPALSPHHRPAARRSAGAGRPAAGDRRRASASTSSPRRAGGSG